MPVSVGYESVVRHVRSCVFVENDVGLEEGDRYIGEEEEEEMEDRLHSSEEGAG